MSELPIAVDFDGTIVEHKYPKVGSPVPGAIHWMKKFQEAGAKLILWTMRDKEELEDAVKYCKENGVEFYGVNENPGQSSWTNSPKAYAKVYIDDAAFGCPLVETDDRPMVDWDQVGPAVLKMIE